MFEFEACEVFKIKEFTIVNDCFKDEHNEEIGHYGQAIFTLPKKIQDPMEEAVLPPVQEFQASFYPGIFC